MKQCNFLDVSGQRFGRLLALWPVGRDKNRHYLFACQCDCGNVITTTSNNLRSGGTQSCKCLKRQKAASDNTKHGHYVDGKPSRTYSSWRSMIERTSNPNSARWSCYGGATPPVTVCESWRTFETFLRDMGPRPAGTSLGRYADTGDYKPSNCSWQTPAQQGLEHRKKTALCKAAKLPVLTLPTMPAEMAAAA